MSKLVTLPGGAAVVPDQLLYLRSVAEGSGGAAGPHALLLRIQGFTQTVPLAVHSNAREADQALFALAARIDEAAAGDAELACLPRALVVKKDEVIFIEVAAEREAAGLRYTVRAKIESDDRPLELAVYGALSDALELVQGCQEALGEDFVVLEGGVLVKKSKVQRVEVRADQSGPQRFFVALAKIQSEARRLTLGRATEAAEAEALAARAVAAVNDDEDDDLKGLPGGFAVRPDGLKGLRVRAGKVASAAGQTIVYTVVLLTDDDDELPIAALEDPTEAEQLVMRCIEAFNGSTEAEAEAEADDDDWD